MVVWILCVISDAVIPTRLPTAEMILDRFLCCVVFGVGPDVLLESLSTGRRF